MVGHTFVYTGAVRKMKELSEAGELGEIYYYDSVRINLGLFQKDVNVLWDLAVHDLAIMDYVLTQRPLSVSCTGVAHLQGRPENIAYMTMFFDSSLIAHVHVNWLSPVKVRRTLLGGSRRMVMFDDLEGSEKIKVYDRGISMNPSPENVYQMLIGYRTGDMSAPQLAVTEALSVEAAHFVECIQQSAKPITDGEAGLRVVRLLEAASESMTVEGPSRRRGKHGRRMIPLVDLPGQFRALKPEIDAAVGRVLENAQYILGPAVSAFEKDFAAFCQTSDAIGVNSGTSALHLSLLAAGVGPGGRGDYRPLHVRGDRGRDRVRRRPAGARGRGAGIPHHGSRPVRGGDYSAHEGRHSGPSLRTAGRHGSDLVHRPEARAGRDRGCLSGSRV